MWRAWIALTLLSSMAPRATADVESAPPASHAGGPPAESIPDPPVGDSLDSIDKTPARPDDTPLEPNLESSPRDSEASPHKLAGNWPDSEASPHKMAANPHDSEANPHVSEASSRHSETDRSDSESSSRVSEARPRDLKSSRSPQRTLNRNASELAWRTWLQSPESRDPGAPPRRITPKSVFIAPYNCPDGKRIQGEGCAKKAQISAAEHERHVLEQLNKMQLGAPPQQLYDYDDDVDAAAGPLQLDLLPPPPPPPPAAVAALTAPAQSFRLPTTVDKKRDPEEAELEAELERLKWQLNRISPPLPNDPQPFHEYHAASLDKPKRDSANHTFPDSNKDQGQKEVIYGSVGVDLAQYLSINRSDITDINNLQKPDDQTNSTGEVPTSETPNITLQTAPAPIGRVNLTVDDASTSHPGHNLKENEKPTKLHPEIDYSDLSEAVKIISRYAEVTTDDMFKSGQKKYSEEEGTLGTRTKLQHRRRPSPAASASPPRSIYEDRVPAHILYPMPALYRYPAPAPPPDYPFRHVQEYWARPERYLGPYAHPNPRRHRHSYSLPQPPHRARRPDPPAAPPADDLYALLGLRHWFSGDGSAER